MNFNIFKSLLIGGIFIFSQGVFAENCVPGFVKENSKYIIGPPGQEQVLKVVKIDVGSCWVKVKEVLSPDMETHYSIDRKNVFWLNMNNVSVIRKKS